MAVITPTPKTQFIGADGVPLAGGKVYTYAAGTTTPQPTYTDSTGATANSNPIILDARGEANIWLGEATYKFRLTDSVDVEIWTVDYIAAPTTAVSPVLSGNVTISTDSSGPALKITQTGSGFALRVQGLTDPDLTPFVITQDGKVGILTAAPAEALDIDDNGKIQFSASGTARTIISADATNSTFDVSDNRNFVVKTNGGTRVTVSGAGATTLAGALTVSSGGAAITGNSSVTGTLTATLFSGPWANIPAGTAMLFAQTAAPTGWTKSTTHDNKALRVVSGSASSGGSVAFTTAFASQSVTGTNTPYALTAAEIPAHTHTATSTDAGHTHASAPAGSSFGVVIGASAYAQIGSGGATLYASGATASGTASITTTIANTGGGGGHTHSFTGTAIDLAVQYVDVIIATKD